MKLSKVLFALLIAALITFPTASEGKDLKTYGKGYSFKKNGWIYVHIEGKPYERGFQYG